MELISIWEQGSTLFIAIRDLLNRKKELKDLTEDELRLLKSFQKHLKELLNFNKFAMYRSQAIKEEVIREDQRPRYFQKEECFRIRKGKCQSTCPEELL